MHIRPMLAPDLDFAAECTAREGWASETRQEFEGFLAYDPGGCFVAEVDGRRAGICVATPYGEFGFVGELIVVEAMRGHGIGRRLLERAVQYLHDCGAQTVYLDGVLAAVSLYERVGFRRVCRSLRFYGRLRAESHSQVRAMRAEDLGAVAALDEEAFGVHRRFFLERRLALYPELCRVLGRKGEITGFILGRRGQGRVSAGPWVMNPDVDRPGDLLECLALGVGDADLGVGVLETNAQAVAALRAVGLTEHPESPWRMALGPPGPYGSPAQCFAIGSPAKG
jgi:ribosomal protein S18 acetylase RimI-like enzyme